MIAVNGKVAAVVLVLTLAAALLLRDALGAGFDSLAAVDRGAALSRRLDLVLAGVEVAS